ncbi:MAG: hypothetical protein K8F91_08175, partial [Candidatus Obscuribacterales bacterium]|nr:hypothetical protein [Candidatus Obscuribacterales bacterium]
MIESVDKQLESTVQDVTLQVLRLTRVMALIASSDERALLSEPLATASGYRMDFQWCDSFEQAIVCLANPNIKAAILDVECFVTEPNLLFGVIQDHPGIAFVVLTTEKTASIAQEAVRRGAEDVVFRDRADLCQSLYRALKYALDSKSLEKPDLNSEIPRSDKQILREVLSFSPVVMVGIDRAYKIRDFNDSFCKLVGKSKYELLRAYLFDVLPGFSKTEAFHCINNGAPGRGRLEVPDAAGAESAFLDFNIWPLLASSGEVRQAVLLGIDVSETIILERQKEEFFAALVHDIRNPLVGQAMVMRMLTEKSDLPDDIAAALLTVKRSNESLLALLNHTVANYEAEVTHRQIDREHLGLPDLIDDVIVSLPVIVDNRIKVNQDLSSGSLTFVGSKTLINRLLTNLICNAVKFSPPGSEVSISLFRKQTDII